MSQSTPAPKPGASPMTIGRILLLFFEGAIIGVGAILPGISGGVLCVVFGIYQPMMELLAHPLRAFPKYWKLFLPVLIGWAVGFLSLAGLIAKLFENDSAVIVSLFIGLICGMFPSLFREGARDGRSKATWTALIVSTAALLAFFLLIQRGESMHVVPNFGWFFFCGALWGVSLIVPGMSSSSLLIYMGLYSPMSAGLAAFDFGVILPFILGILAVLVMLTRLVDMLFKRHYGVAFHCIIGFVIASTIPIIPLSFKSVWEGLLCLVMAVIGFFGAYYMDRWSMRVGAQQEESDPAAASQG